MLTGWQTRAALAEAFGIPHEAITIALACVRSRQEGHGRVYRTEEAAKAAMDYCKARAQDAELRAKSNRGHGCGYARKRALMWNERAVKIRREYLTEVRLK